MFEDEFLYSVIEKPRVLVKVHDSWITLELVSFLRSQALKTLRHKMRFKNPFKMCEMVEPRRLKILNLRPIQQILAHKELNSSHSFLFVITGACNLSHYTIVLSKNSV